MHLDEQSNLMLWSHRGQMTTWGLLPCKTDSEVFALDELLVYTVSVREQVYLYPKKTEGCTEMSKMHFSHLLAYHGTVSKGKNSQLYFFRGFRGVNPRWSVQCNRCRSGLGLCCCVPGCPQGCSSYKVTLETMDVNSVLWQVFYGFSPLRLVQNLYLWIPVQLFFSCQWASAQKSLYSFYWVFFLSKTAFIHPN